MRRTREMFCGHCSELVQRVNEWHARHGGSSRWYDLQALLGPHPSLERVATLQQNPEGESLLHRCGICGSYWTIHVWAAINDVNIYQADDAIVQRWAKDQK